MLAPIVLFVYKRIWHTRKTVESLKNNLLADKSELFIFSDGPKNEKDTIQVEEVRSYLNSLDGFKKIEIIASNENKGLANSIINGVTITLKKFGKAIVLEDDLVSSPYFLNFMNDALDFYKEEFSIYSISGYGFPIEIPVNYKKDVYILPRSSSWGWATWLNRWEKADWKVTDYGQFRKNKMLHNQFNRGGNDLTPMLMSQMNNYLDSWGIKWAYTHFKNSAFCLFPVVSQIQNIGTDASGTHFTRGTKKFDIDLSSNIDEIKLDKELELDERILTRVRKLFNISVIRKIINLFRFHQFLA
ncbi:MAG: hypothetical protein WCE54_01890 [Ignavibacteriaceae bacterium]